MFNLHYSGIVISKSLVGRIALRFDGLLISTETNPYYQYFDPYYVNTPYIISFSTVTEQMRYLVIDEYTYTLPTKIPFLENRMYHTIRLRNISYNYFIYIFLHMRVFS